MSLSTKLDTTDTQILAGKKALADALLQVGITAVEPNPNNPDSYETFQSYADKIKRLMISNSFILEFTIPEEGFDSLTKYKRTLMLPMYNNNDELNGLAQQIIESDTGYTSSATISTFSTFDEAGIGTTMDAWGNTVADGSVEWIESEESKLMSREAEMWAELAKIPAVAAIDEGSFSFTVDWGDGSPAQDFVSMTETPDAWWHTYEQPGTYDVTINGVFKSPYCAAGWLGNIVIDGDYVYDRDGTPVLSANNYFMKAYLNKVIAWGNTQFYYMWRGFCRCSKLVSIPTLDTTNSFEKVIAMSNLFYYSGIQNIPYDTNTMRGLCSNCPELISVAYMFGVTENMTGELPETIYDNCPKINTFTCTFESIPNIRGQVPAKMFAGASGVTSIQRMFESTPIEGELDKDLFANNTELTDMSLAFNGTNIGGIFPAGLFANQSKCQNVAGFVLACNFSSIEPGALSGLSSCVVYTRMFEENDMLESIEPGVVSDIAVNAVAPLLFSNCSILSAIPCDILSELTDARDARSLFGSCGHISAYTGGGQTLEIPEVVRSDYQQCMKYSGIVAYCGRLPDYEDIPAELGGNGARLFPQYHVGMICLDDDTMVEPKDFVYNLDNPPIGVCYYSDNSVDKCCCLSALRDNMISLQRYTDTHWSVDDNPMPIVSASDLPTNVGLCYGAGDGESITRQCLSWNKYLTDKSVYSLWLALENYHVGSHADRFFWLGGFRETADMIFNIPLIRKACEAIKAGAGTDYTSANCYPPNYSSSALARLTRDGLVYMNSEGLWAARLVSTTQVSTPCFSVHRQV